MKSNTEFLYAVCIEVEKLLDMLIKLKKWYNPRLYIVTVRLYNPFICNFLKLTHENSKI